MEPKNVSFNSFHGYSFSVTSSDDERSFSTLKLITTTLERNITVQEVLNRLSLMNCHSSIPLNPSVVIKVFFIRQPCRLLLASPFEGMIKYYFS